MTLEQTLASFGIEIIPDFTIDKIQRSGAQWLRAYRWEIDVVFFGDYKRDINESWQGSDSHFTPDQKKEFEAKKKKALADAAKAREEEWVRIRDEIKKEWLTFHEIGTTPYLERKKINQLYGCKIHLNEHSTAVLLIPMRDTEGLIWNYQRIWPMKLSSGNDKAFMSGGKVHGLFHTLSPIYPEGTIYIAEGFATAASICMSLQESVGVVCAFNADNLEPVSVALRGKYPKAKLIICSDNDAWTCKPDGTPWNPGKEKARAAAYASQGEVLLPVFKDVSTHPTDFNDLHCLEGLAEVKKQLLNPGEKVEFAITHTKQGKVKLPPPQLIADSILKSLTGTVVKQERDLFRYTGTHWVLMTMGECDAIKVEIQRLCEKSADSHFIDGVYRLILLHLPSVPRGVDLFTPNPFCINVKNGTLHLIANATHEVRFEFRPHNALDYLVNILPFNYDPTDEHRNREMEDCLTRVFEGDPDSKTKKLQVMEMYGAAIAPLFPRLYMLYGKPGTGKSTIANICARLVHKDNLSSVPPSEWRGFGMESMIGKLVNIDTDIPFDGVMRDEVVKKVIERKNFLVRRKGIKDIIAPIPSLHVFCGNGMPRFLDGGSGAHGRRWTIIEFNRYVIPDGTYDQEYWDYVFELDPQGIFNFALAGVKRLMEARGSFTVSASGKEKLQTLQLVSSDPVTQFFYQLEEGEIEDRNSKVMLEKTAKIERKQLWEIYKNWHLDALGNAPRAGKLTFYDAVRNKGHQIVTVRGVRYFEGISVGMVQSAIG